MNRHGSPNISAIEDRALSQAERNARLRAEMAAEAAEREIRLVMANQTGTVVGKLKTGRGLNLKARIREMRAAGRDDVSDLIQDREPCFNCGVRQDRHREFGCKRWRAM